MKKGKKIIYIVSIISGIIAFLLLIMLLLLPHAIKRGDIKEKVVTLLSQKISGDVEFQAIDISFFPLPHLTVDHLIIHFSNGNKLSLASLKIYPSLLHLIAGDLRISKIYADSPEISLMYVQKQESSTKKQPDLKALKILDNLSSLSSVLKISINNGLLDILKGKRNILTIKNISSDISLQDNMLEVHLVARTAFSKSISVTTELHRSQSSFKKIILDIDGEDINVPLAREAVISFVGGTPLLETIFTYMKEGDISSVSFHSEGSSIEDLGKIENMLIQGHLEHGTVFIPDLQLEFKELKGDCGIRRGILEGDELEAKLGDAHLLRGSLRIGLSGYDAPFHFEVDTRTDFDMASRLLKRFLKEPPFPLNSLQIIKSSVEGKIVVGESTKIFKEWKEKGIFAFNGTINVIDGPEINIDISANPAGVVIKHLNIHDNESDAKLKLNLKQKLITLFFKGNLTNNTLGKFIKISSLNIGSISGKFDATIDVDNTARSIARGYLSARNISTPWKGGLPLDINQISLKAVNNRINIETADINIAHTPLSMKGIVDLTLEGLKTDMDISAESLRWETVQMLIASQPRTTRDEQKDTVAKLSLTGSLRIKAQKILFDKAAIDQLNANVSIFSDFIRVKVNEASLCGISMPGRIDIADNAILLDFSLADKQKELEPTMTCLTDQRSIITGTFDYEGLLKAQSKPDRLLQSLRGHLNLDAKNGRIYKAATFAKIFSLLSVSGIFKGSIIDLTKEGFKYNSIVINADIQNGNIILNGAVMDAPSMKMVGVGNIDMIKERLNIKILASPLKNVDNIVGKIPIIKDITGDSLVAVPISVAGDLKNPTVDYLPISGVGTGLLGIMKNTMRLPVKIFRK